MGELLWIIIYRWGAGLAIGVGSAAARFLPGGRREIVREFIHLAVAFGGDVLVAAIAFTLVPTGLSTLPLYGQRSSSSSPAPSSSCGLMRA